MQRPLQLSWRNVPPSDAVEAMVREEVARLERASGRITTCKVALEAPARGHHRQGGAQFRVRVELTMPGGRLVVGRDPRETTRHADLYATVKEAFREARRQVEDRVRRIDRRVKTHEEPARGEVVRLFPVDGYGFLRTRDGREIYFHARSVLGTRFARLHVGTRVTFVEEPGDDGPQASTVRPLRGKGQLLPA